MARRWSVLDINSQAVTGAVKLTWLGSLLGRLSCLIISLNTTVRKTKRTGVGCSEKAEEVDSRINS